MKKKRKSFSVEKHRIFHIYDIAGVAQTLVKYLKKKGVRATLMLRKTHRWATSASKDSVIIHGPVKFFKLMLLFKVINYRVIHIHAADEFIPLIKFFYPKKKIILTYHGSDIRGKWEQKKMFWQKADLVTVSTNDLLNGAPEEAIYTPNIVDTELFSRTREPIPKSAFFMLYTRFEKNQSMPIKLAKKIAKENNMSLVIWKRDEWGFIPYDIFPKILSMFENFIDTRIDHLGRLIPSPSLTALQMLSLGGKVFLAENTIHELPEEHTPEKAVEMWCKLYDLVGNS